MANLKDHLSNTELSEVSDFFSKKFGVGAEAALLKCEKLRDGIFSAKPSTLSGFDKIEIIEARTHRSRNFLDYDVWGSRGGKRYPIDLSPLEDTVASEIVHDPSLSSPEIISEIFFELLLHGDNLSLKPTILQSLTEEV